MEKVEYEVIYPEKNTLVKPEQDDSEYKHNFILDFKRGMFEGIANDYDGGTEGSRRTYKGTVKHTQDEHFQELDIDGILEFTITDAEYYLYGSGAAE